MVIIAEEEGMAQNHSGSGERDGSTSRGICGIGDGFGGRGGEERGYMMMGDGIGNVRNGGGEE